jgi:hypothetical protein
MEAEVEELSYSDFVRAHDLPPLVDVKTACKVAGIGMSRLYQLKDAGVFTFLKNSSRTNISALNLFQYYRSLVAAAADQTAA